MSVETTGPAAPELLEVLPAPVAAATAGRPASGLGLSGLAVDVGPGGREVVLAGRLDARTAPLVRAVLHAAIERGEGDLRVRMAGVEMWGGIGMGVLVGAHALARRRGRRLLLVDVPPRPLRQLRTARVDRVIEVRPLRPRGAALPMVRPRSG